METQTHLPEGMLIEILARLPLRSIPRFKLVCKTWKSILESLYFRRHFLSVHRNSSSPWSLMYEEKQLITFPGCKTWDLPNSPTSFIPAFFKSYDHPPASSNEFVLIEGSDRTCFLGSPILQQWLKIPPPPVPVDSEEPEFGFVARADEDDVVFSFKVFCLAYLSDVMLELFLYSSETGTWTSKIIHCSHQINNDGYISMNTTVYFFSEPGLLLGYDFYSDSDQFRVLHYPHYSDDKDGTDFKRSLSVCGRSFMYIRTLAQKEQTVFKVWRLHNDFGDGSWQLLWEISIPIIGSYVPISVNPFDSGVVYLWSLHDHHVVSCDLRTQKHKILSEEHKECFIDQSVCEKSMDEIWGSESSDEEYEVSVWLFQIVLPRWIESVPRPPQAEMIDTTSLLSYINSMQEI